MKKGDFTANSNNLTGGDTALKAGSMANSGGYTHNKTFSSLANIPKHKRQKLV